MRSISQKMLALCLWMLVLLPVSLLAQEATDKKKYTFVAQGEPLDYSLQKLVNKTDIDLIYDPRLMSEHSVYVQAENENPENILRIILEGSELDFIQLSSGTYVLVKDNREASIQGNMIGKVIDQTSGKPLRGAHVMLADASTGTSTNSAGRFTIPKLEPGRHEITITYVGYQPVKDTVWVPAGNSSPQHSFSLETKPVWVEPIVVSDTRKLLPAADTFTGTVENPRKAALGTIDAVKSMNSIMGINFNLGLADYNIQGGNNTQNQLRLDDVPIYNPVSMGRLIGAFSPYALGTIDVYKAGYGTTVGSQLSGIVNLNHDLGSNKEQSLLLQADLLNLNGRFDHTLNIGDGPDINLMLAGRTNIWRWYKKPTLVNTFKEWDQIDPLLTNRLLDISSTNMSYLQKNHNSDIRYSDLHLAALIEHSDFQTTQISAYRGKNFLQTDLFSENVELASNAPNHMFTIDRYNWTNWMGKIEHEWLVNPRLDAGISSYVTKHSLQHQYAMGNNLNTRLNFAESVSDQLYEGAIRNMNTGNQNGVMELAAAANFDYSVNTNYQIKTSLKATHLNYRFHLSDLYVNTAHSESTSFLLSSFIQNNFFLSNQTSLSAGSRFTFIPSRDLVFAEPRFSLQHDEPETAIGYLSTKLSGGIYRQFINQFDVSNIAPSALVPSMRFWVPVDFSTDVPKAYHLSGDLLWEPDEYWTVKGESYYKWMPTTLSLDYRELFDYSIIGPRNLESQAQFITNSQQYAYGGGISIERVLPSLQMQLKGKYQYSQTRRRIEYRFDGEYESVPWNYPHQLGISAEWQAFPDFMILVQWESIWGQSWGFRKAYYDYLSIFKPENLQNYDFEDPSDDQLPAFQQLDAGISYKLNLEKGNLRMRIDVFNLLDHKNIMNWWLYPTQTEANEISYAIKERKLPGFSPSFSIKFTF
jgi:hypothetical protein